MYSYQFLTNFNERLPIGFLKIVKENIHPSVDSYTRDRINNIITVTSSEEIKNIKDFYSLKSFSIEDIRAKRNMLLLSSDWTQVLDSPLPRTEVEQWAIYRQLLRDITVNLGEQSRWPCAPNSKQEDQPVEYFEIDLNLLKIIDKDQTAQIT